jgi:steroid delta-isomerase-like uncharacterized protein
VATAPSATETASVAQAYFDAIAAHDLEGMKACWDLEGVDVLHGLAELRGPDAVAEWFGNLFEAMPDFRIEVTNLLPEDDKVAVHWQLTGTFDGRARFEGMIPNGARVDLGGCDVLTVRDGRIVHNDAYMNATQMAQQLGAMPPQGSGPERALIGAVNLKTRLTALLRRG